MIKLAIAGARGRMGSSIINYIMSGDLSSKFEIVAALLKDDDKFIGQPVENLENLNYSNKLEGAVAESNALIDFTTPENTVLLAQKLQGTDCSVISGVTGFSNEQLDKLQKLSKNTKFFWSPNMSIGISIISQAASNMAAKMPSDFDIEILEMHHRNKVDAPSGTAIHIAEKISSSLPEHKINYDLDRNKKRKEKDICFNVLRGGSIVGEHSIMFAGDNEVITLTHRAQNREIFVKGALVAAEFMLDKKPGKIYSMEDM